jgi:excinuclease UvrABC nuclease subunit
MELLDDKMRVWLDSAKFVKPISGIYVLYNRSKEPIFIGETNNLETTFTKYVDTEFEGNECMQKTSSYQRIFTDNQKQEQLELIEKYKNETGKLPSFNSEIKIETP